MDWSLYTQYGSNVTGIIWKLNILKKYDIILVIVARPLMHPLALNSFPQKTDNDNSRYCTERLLSWNEATSGLSSEMLNEDEHFLEQLSLSFNAKTYSARPPCFKAPCGLWWMCVKTRSLRHIKTGVYDIISLNWDGNCFNWKIRIKSHLVAHEGYKYQREESISQSVIILRKLDWTQPLLLKRCDTEKLCSFSDT